MRKGKDRGRVKPVALRPLSLWKAGMSARIRDLSSLAALLLLAGCGGDLCTTIPSSGITTPIFTSPVDEARLVTLTGNVPLAARAGFDEGTVDEGVIGANTRLDRML